MEIEDSNKITTWLYERNPKARFENQLTVLGLNAF